MTSVGSAGCGLGIRETEQFLSLRTRGRKCVLLTYVISNMGWANSITIRLGSKSYRTLIDTGTESSVINGRALNPRLELTTWLIHKLKQVITSTPQKLSVVKIFKADHILGRGWLKQNRVNMYLDFIINNEYMVLEEYNNILYIVRWDRSVVMKPQYIHTYLVKTRTRKGKADTYQTELLTSRYLSNLYSITVGNAVVMLDNLQKIEILIMNTKIQLYQ